MHWATESSSDKIFVCVSVSQPEMCQAEKKILLYTKKKGGEQPLADSLLSRCIHCIHKKKIGLTSAIQLGEKYWANHYEFLNKFWKTTKKGTNKQNISESSRQITKKKNSYVVEWPTANSSPTFSLSCSGIIHIVILWNASPIQNWFATIRTVAGKQRNESVPTEVEAIRSLAGAHVYHAILFDGGLDGPPRSGSNTTLVERGAAENEKTDSWPRKCPTVKKRGNKDKPLALTHGVETMVNLHTCIATKDQPQNEKKQRKGEVCLWKRHRNTEIWSSTTKKKWSPNSPVWRKH